MAETINTIQQWVISTFGKTNAHIKKFDEEWLEFIQAKTKDEKLKELVDVYIVVCAIGTVTPEKTKDLFAVVDKAKKDCNFSDTDFQNAIDKKMEINRSRVWRFQNGVFHHI